MKYTFDLLPDELIKIGEIPYRYVGDGQVNGGTNPKLARGMRDGAEQQTGAQSNDENAQ